MTSRFVPSESKRRRCVGLPLVELVPEPGSPRPSCSSHVTSGGFLAQFLLQVKSGLHRFDFHTWIECGELVLSGIHEQSCQIRGLITRIFGESTRRQGSLGFLAVLVTEYGDQRITQPVCHGPKRIDPACVWSRRRCHRAFRVWQPGE